MGSMFRSEEMALCQLFIQPEAAYASVATMGEAGVVQFRDLNSEMNVFQRKFVSEVRRCDELERKLRYIQTEVHKDHVHVPVPESSVFPFAPNPREIINLESQLERTENEILELSHNAVNLKSNYLELTELRHVLEKTHAFFEESFSFQQQDGTNASGTDSMTKALISDEALNNQSQVTRGRLGFVAGVVPRERVPGFERMLWRISRGNVFLRRAELEESLEDPATGNEIFKTVFVAFFQGEQLKSRVKKVCSGFHASFYNCPSAHSERQEMLKGVKTRLEDLNMVLNQTRDHRQRVLTTVAKELHNWGVMVRKMKAIYHTLNLFNMDVTKKCLIGECWIPIKDLQFIRQTLAEGSKAVGSSIPSFLNIINTNEKPPTFNRTNRFTQGFQNLVDSYGIAGYREVNPALYTIITFPFLFGIMFGDAGHGIILSAFGAYMVLYEQQLSKTKSSNEIWNIFFGGRYIILLMGLFSIYTGIIYNDIFSKSMNIFGSSWTINTDSITVLNNKSLILNPSTNFTQIPYPLGLDPVWQVAVNKIIFLNSYKMKLSIIFGVVHMMFGVILSVVNHVHFNKKHNILLQFIPQMLFLVLLFFYMVSLMFMKWILYGPQNPQKTGPGCAPSVLIMFINMMLFKHTTPFEGCDEYMFEGQERLQKCFVVIALLCIPVMLLGKPLYIILYERRSKNCESESSRDINGSIELKETEVSNMISSPANHEEEEPASELFIHQSIETIEYVLSTVSHTASYLRLWALSLAHAQLSEVLWSMVLRLGLDSETHWGAIKLYVFFGVWSLFTLAILVMMEGLSAFLHTLRLHWVEFMSKFYVGNGYAFQPFWFKNVLENEETIEE
ncbi:V-type proton ATPase 116 kDa subunit a 1 isoform X2 [Daktulosphaira vitifoliae]|uniref:V-type proton ATPase 116 kDa subunit a 1 isoform X2 n=1 Tax=Daktulosphaira vitifoliae TaxID=58002 RepID=UPI0021AA9E9B|nr:V-type proton ATPase 116 kDa subunit a 1 isoform X2 [Daktulosphaira vitifoliae]